MDLTTDKLFVDSFLSNDILLYIPESSIITSDEGQLIRNEPKTGRNDPCPCGSGKKFKKCCAGKIKNTELLYISNKEKKLKESDFTTDSLGYSDIRNLRGYELEQIDFTKLNHGQLVNCYRKALDLNNYDLVHNILIHLRKLYKPGNGKLEIKNLEYKKLPELIVSEFDGHNR